MVLVLVGGRSVEKFNPISLIFVICKRKSPILLLTGKTDIQRIPRRKQQLEIRLHHHRMVVPQDALRDVLPFLLPFDPRFLIRLQDLVEFEEVVFVGGGEDDQLGDGGDGVFFFFVIDSFD